MRCLKVLLDLNDFSQKSKAGRRKLFETLKEPLLQTSKVCSALLESTVVALCSKMNSSNFIEIYDCRPNSGMVERQTGKRHGLD